MPNILTGAYSVLCTCSQLPLLDKEETGWGGGPDTLSAKACETLVLCHKTLVLYYKTLVLFYKTLVSGNFDLLVVL